MVMDTLRAAVRHLAIIPGGGSLGSGIALFALNFILAGIIGGFVLVWRLIVAVWYVRSRQDLCANLFAGSG